MTIDERIQFLIQSQESLGKNIEELYETVKRNEQRLEAQEKRERQAREALLSGIAAYLRALSNGGEI